MSYTTETVRRYCFLPETAKITETDVSNVIHSIRGAKQAINYCRENPFLMCVDIETGLICYEVGSHYFDLAYSPWRVILR
jgi:hypothetical protein